MPIFDSQFSVAHQRAMYPVSEVEQAGLIKYEPMFFSASMDFALKHGGTLTQHFLFRLPDEFGDDPSTIIDSRSHMLMKGWYPCIPGFHHDDVPREREDGQPEYQNPSYKAEHAMMLFGDASITEFAVGKAEFPEVALGYTCYKVWHPMVVDKIKTGELFEAPCPVNAIVLFNWNTWHQGTPARKNGWRWFIRATRNTKRPHQNEIRKQVQVYLEFPMEGW